MPVGGLTSEGAITEAFTLAVSIRGSGLTPSNIEPRTLYMYSMLQPSASAVVNASNIEGQYRPDVET